MTRSTDPTAPVVGVGVSDGPASLWDERDPATRIDGQLARAEVAAWKATRAAAEQQAAIVEVLAEARRHPEVYVVLRAEPTDADVRFAVEAAISDLALRLALSEATVAALARQAELVRARAPRTWAVFREGEISAPNVRSLAAVLESLPADGECDARVDARALELAALTPARFRERLRVFRERVHPRPLTERHDEARATRGVSLEHGPDGMAWLGLHLPAADAELAWQRLDAGARHLATRPGESRTLDQLRADVAADVLTGRDDPETAPRITVGVLVPVLTLLGSDEPALLDGRIPIDADTARRLAGHAPSFHRILTHPISSAVLDVDRTSYRPPADLARWLALRDGTCRHPGCGIPARRCDLDHTVAWADGGTTSARNLAHLSRRHHTLKHRTRWTVERRPDGVLEWTSPTGFTRAEDPPPF